MSEVLTDAELKDQAAELEAALATGMPETLTFYEGTEVIYYRDDLHAYYKKLDDGKLVMVVGVTSALDKIDKPALVQWAANTTVDHLREKAAYSQFRDGKGVVHTFITQENLEAMFNDARFNWREISHVAMDIGKLAHGWLEAFVGHLITNKAAVSGTMHGDCVMPVVDDPKAHNCIDAALAWMQKHHFEPIGTERKIYSREYSYSGTYDWLAYITACGDPVCCPFEGRVLALGDWKSSKRLYDEYRVQTSAYVNAHEEEFPDQKIGVRVLIRLGKEDGEFEAMVLSQDSQEADFAGFLGALGIYNWDRQLKIDKKYAKTMAKIVADEAKALAKATAKEEKEAAKAQAKLQKEQAKETAKQEKETAKLAAKALKPPKKVTIKELPQIAA